MQKQQHKRQQGQTPETSTSDFKQDEKAAQDKWEKEKDSISGVDKKIEHKLEKGDLNPEDTQNLGD